MGCGASSRVAPAPPDSAPTSAHKHALVFWDVENCPVPNGTAASDVVSAIRSWLSAEGWPSQPPDGHVVAAYNVFASRAPTFWNQLKHAGVEQLAAGPKAEAADRELELRMRREMRLLPAGESRTCIVLISSDMDFLSTVRDELRGRVTVIWVHAAGSRLPEPTLRQIEEATRPSSCREPRPTDSLPSWEQLLAEFASPGAASNAASGSSRSGRQSSGGGSSRSRSRSRSRGRGNNSHSPPSSSPPPIDSSPVGTTPHSPTANHSPQPSLATTPASPTTVSSPLPPHTLADGQQRCTGMIQHWDSQPHKLWGYVMSDQMAGGQQQKHHFRRTDILDPCPDPVRRGMLVEFTPGVNPPGGKHGGKPLALEVRFVDQPASSE